ncbi:vomeronasal type-2 receptor 26-like [Engystomops pustulosus]|uniref:vomeronasal type-2 receptor 26-like n=1 Tax=Engystomops pustulosus TaxID=76066 RepID=UPI003AFB2747
MSSEISYGATDPSLSDRLLYPHVFRTVQSSHTHNMVIIELLKYFGWTWVGILVSDDDAGENELQILTKYMRENGICAAFTITMTEENSDYNNKTLHIISKSQVNVIIICGTMSMNGVLLLYEYVSVLLHKTLILPPSWTSSSTITSNRYSGFNGSLGLDFSSPPFPKTEYFIKNYKKLPNIYQYELMWKSLEVIKGNDDNLFLLLNLSPAGSNSSYVEAVPSIRYYLSSGVTPRVYEAVEILAKSLHEIILHIKDKYKENPITGLVQYTGKLQRYIQRMKNSRDPVSPSYYFTDQGEALHPYKIVNWIFIKEARREDIKMAEVGNFTPWAASGQKLHLNPQSITWRHTQEEMMGATGLNADPEVASAKYLAAGPLNPGVPPLTPEHGELTTERSNVVFVFCLLYGEALAWATPLWDRGHPDLATYTTFLAKIWSRFEQPQIPVSRCSNPCFPGSRKKPRATTHICCYDCVPCSEGGISNITGTCCIQCESDEWPNEERDRCLPKVIEFISYQNDPMASVFSCLSLFGCLVTSSIFTIFISYRDTPIVKANNRNLSYLLLVSIFLSFLSVFLFLGRPSDVTCRLRETSFGVFFSVAVSSLLAKTVMVCVAFKSTKPGSPWRRWLSVKLPYTIVLLCSSIQVVLCVIWLSISPPFQDLDTQSSPGKIIIQCNEGSDICFYSMLGYMGLLAAGSFLLAFMVRTLPDSFNEAKYITFSMLLFCSVWISMIPAYLSTRGKYMVAVEIFAVMASSAGLLGCVFFPKCFTILFRYEMNTKIDLLRK